MEEVEVVLDRHEQQIKTLERDMTDMKGNQFNYCRWQCQFAMQIDRRVKDAAPYGVSDKSQFAFFRKKDCNMGKTMLLS